MFHSSEAFSHFLHPAGAWHAQHELRVWPRSRVPQREGVIGLREFIVEHALAGAHEKWDSSREEARAAHRSGTPAPSSTLPTCLTCMSRLRGLCISLHVCSVCQSA